MPGGQRCLNDGLRFQNPSVEHEDFRGYTAQIGKQRIRLAGLRPQMNIG